MVLGGDTDSRLGAGDGNEVPVDRPRLYERVYPFGWLGLLADVPPLKSEPVYTKHHRRFAVCSKSGTRRLG